MSDTPDRITLLLENLDEWIDDSLRKSKPIGLTLCAARSTIADHRARITELWDALETLRRERDEAREALEFRRGLYKVQEERLEKVIKELAEAREKYDQVCHQTLIEINKVCDERDKLREALREVLKVSEPTPVLTYQKMEDIASKALKDTAK